MLKYRSPYHFLLSFFFLFILVFLIIIDFLFSYYFLLLRFCFFVLFFASSSSSASTTTSSFLLPLFIPLLPIIFLSIFHRILLTDIRILIILLNASVEPCWIDVAAMGELCVGLTILQTAPVRRWWFRFHHIIHITLVSLEKWRTDLAISYLKYFTFYSLISRHILSSQQVY